MIDVPIEKKNGKQILILPIFEIFPKILFSQFAPSRRFPPPLKPSVPHAPRVPHYRFI